MVGNNRSSVVMGLSAMATLAAAWILAATASAQPAPPPPPPPQEQPAQGTPAGGQPGAGGEARRVRWSQQIRLPKDVAVTKDIEYARAGDLSLRLDLYVPQSAPKPRPLVVWIHGGGWRTGSKEQCRATFLVQHGYVVASINYRLVHEGRWPAQIEDCKAAIRWLRSQADAYGIDPQRIGVWGSSAGGHLAAMLGTSGDVKELEGALGNLDRSSRVQAVCDWCGPSDLVALAALDPKRGQSDPNAPDAPEAILLGGPIRNLLDKARAASPITYVTADDPPFLIMHGDNDRVVPYPQSVLLDEALRKAGVESTLHTVAGAGHAFGGQALHEIVLDFFNRHLKPKPAAASPTDAAEKPTPAATAPAPATDAAPATAPMQSAPTAAP